MQLSPHALPLWQTLQHTCPADIRSVILADVSLFNKLSDVHCEEVGVDSATGPAPRAPRLRAKANITNRIQRRILVIASLSLPRGFQIVSEKFYTVDDCNLHRTKCNKMIIVWHLARSLH